MLNLVAGNLAGVERQAAASGSGAEQKVAPAKQRLLLCMRRIGDESGHTA